MSAPPSPASGQSGNSQAQLRFFQILAVLLAVLLAGGAAYVFYRQRQIQPVAILVNGKTITTVENATEAKQILRSVLDDSAGPAFIAQGQPHYKEAAQLQRVSDASQLDTDDSAKAKLSAALHVTVIGDVIVIDHKPIVALPDKDTAQAALDAVRKHYSDMPPNDPIVDKPSFREKVEIVRQRVSASITKSTADEAAPLLWTSPPARTYTVQFHDTGWSISRKFHMQFADFLRANSGRDINHLAPGDTVSVSQTYPPLTVIVKKQTDKEEPIIKGASEDSAGLRRITLITTYINGVEAGPGEAVNIYTIRRAQPRRYLD
ncbi:MAG TPA: LysM domain-containing protein [Capsulimonadaceae bacterium]|nr:LysM domain-containing protein [Capsulimonadaceae bacterium]